MAKWRYKWESPNPKSKCECVSSQNNEKTILVGVQDVVWNQGIVKTEKLFVSRSMITPSERNLYLI